MKNLFYCIADKYLKYPIFYDILFFAIICLNVKWPFFSLPDVKNINNNWIQDIYSNLISTSISLAGFILAALTIIVTFKSSVQAKLNDQDFEKLNGLELILSSKLYQQILCNFKNAIYELIIVFVILLFFWIFQYSFAGHILFYALIYSGISISLCILRTILVLFKILMLDK